MSARPRSAPPNPRRGDWGAWREGSPPPPGGVSASTLTEQSLADRLEAGRSLWGRAESRRVYSQSEVSQIALTPCRAARAGRVSTWGRRLAGCSSTGGDGRGIHLGPAAGSRRWRRPGPERAQACSPARGPCLPSFHGSFTLRGAFYANLSEFQTLPARERERVVLQQVYFTGSIYAVFWGSVLSSGGYA
jgi:hypothetical protein